MTTYCKLIKFPQKIKDLLSNDPNVINLTIPEQWAGCYGSVFVPPEQFPKEFDAWLEDMFDLKIAIAEIFWLKPFGKHPIHVDGMTYPIYKGKLNFVIDGAESEMVWYQPKSENFKLKEFGPKAGYLYIDVDDTTELHRQKLTDFCIVDAGTFHTVENKNEFRIAWNLVLADCASGNRLLLSDLQTRFSEYVLD
jgi:hypothetical protein